MPAFRAACAARGWNAAVAPSLATRKGGKTAGVAVLARAHLDRIVLLRVEAADGRWVMAELSTRLLGKVTVCSFYGHVGAESETKKRRSQA